jgi:hypothetical protein
MQIITKLEQHGADLDKLYGVDLNPDAVRAFLRTI